MRRGRLGMQMHHGNRFTPVPPLVESPKITEKETRPRSRGRKQAFGDCRNRRAGASRLRGMAGIFIFEALNPELRCGADELAQRHLAASKLRRIAASNSLIREALPGGSQRRIIESQSHEESIRGSCR